MPDSEMPPFAGNKSSPRLRAEDHRRLMMIKHASSMLDFSASSSTCTPPPPKHHYINHRDACSLLSTIACLLSAVNYRDACCLRLLSLIIIEFTNLFEQLTVYSYPQTLL